MRAAGRERGATVEPAGIREEVVAVGVGRGAKFRMGRKGWVSMRLQDRKQHRCFEEYMLKVRHA